MPLGHICNTTGDKRSSSPSIVKEFYDVQLPLPNQMERCSSNTSILSYSKDICRICHCEGDESSPLIAPCFCAGSLCYVHQSCLQQWIKSSNTKNCELCKFLFIMNTKVKPFNKWEILDLSWVEKKKILCSVTFHGIAIFCVVWSLFVLIQRTSQEVQEGSLEWPFWTKIIVVAIGFSGSIVFMYVQCKMYYQLCRRWRAYNRVIYVQNAPEKKEHFSGKPRSPSFTVECEKKSYTVSVVGDRMSQESVRSYSPEGNVESAIPNWPHQASIEDKGGGAMQQPELENLIPTGLRRSPAVVPSMVRTPNCAQLSGPPEEVFGCHHSPFRPPAASAPLAATTMNCQSPDRMSHRSDSDAIDLTTG